MSCLEGQEHAFSLLSVFPTMPDKFIKQQSAAPPEADAAPTRSVIALLSATLVAEAPPSLSLARWDSTSPAVLSHENAARPSWLAVTRGGYRIAGLEHHVHKLLK